MLFLTIKDYRIHFATHLSNGSEWVIFLHHGLGTLMSWKKQITDFNQAGFNILTYDRQGYGQSSGIPCKTIPTFESDLEDLKILMTFNQIEKAHLVGHSDGGTISLYFSNQYPLKVKKIVVIAGHIYIEPKMVSTMPEFRKQFYKKSRFHQGLKKAHFGNHVNVFENWYQNWRSPKVEDWDMRDEISGITKPTLVIQGTDDDYATDQHAKDLNDCLPNSKLWLVNRGTHMIPQDMPEEFNKKVVDFLNDDMDDRAGVDV